MRWGWGWSWGLRVARSRIARRRRSGLRLRSRSRLRLLILHTFVLLRRFELVSVLGSRMLGNVLFLVLTAHVVPPAGGLH